MSAPRSSTAPLDWLNNVALWVFEIGLLFISRRRYQGVRNIPKTGAAVVVSNHISMADALITATTIGRAGRRPKFMGMKELFSWRIVGPLVGKMGHIPVDRGTKDAAAALQPALTVLADQQIVALYPEGKVTTTPDYRPLPTGKTGAARLALTAGCPVVPVAQWGAHQLLTREHDSTLTRPVRLLGWLRSGREHRRPRIRVLVGQPISHETLLAAATVPGREDLDYRAATDLIMNRIRVLLADIAPDLPDLFNADEQIGEAA